MKTTLKIIIPFFLFFSLSGQIPDATTFNQEKRVETWFRIKAPPGKKVLFIAEEEAEFIKKQIGDWLPINLLLINGSWVDIQMTKLSRLNNKIEFAFKILSDTGTLKEFRGSFSDKANDQEIPCIIYPGDEEGTFYMEIECHDNDFGAKPHKSSRRIMFQWADSKESLKKRIKVSKAMPGFVWEEATIWSF